MEEKNQPFIQLPHDMGKSIKPREILVYLVIKKFMNTKTKIAFPSLSTIAEISGISIPTIRKAITNLEAAHYIKVIKTTKGNQYHFINPDQFEKIPTEFIDNKDLHSEDKAYLAAIRHLMFVHDTDGIITYPNSKIAEEIKMSESYVVRRDRSLQKQNYMFSSPTKKRDLETGCLINEKVYHLDRLHLAIIQVLKNHEERLTNMEEKMYKMEKENLELKEFVKKFVPNQETIILT